MRTKMLALLGLLAFSCGSDLTDAGGGSRTLLVTGSASFDEGGGSMRVEVRRAGAPVTGATVKVLSDLGTVTLTHTGEGVYRGGQAGWASFYSVSVTAGEHGEDHLEGSIAAPQPPLITSPSPSLAF